MIALGDRVKDPITGIAGLAYTRIVYMQGCDRIGIQGPTLRVKGKLPEVPELYYVDEPQLVVVTKAKKPKRKTKNGGPSAFGPSYKQPI